MAYIISFYKKKKYIYIYIISDIPLKINKNMMKKKKIIKTIIMITSDLLEVESTIPTLLVG